MLAVIFIGLSWYSVPAIACAVTPVVLRTDGFSAELPALFPSLCNTFSHLCAPSAGAVPAPP